MIRLPLKTVRVENPCFAEGVVINAENFDPALNVLFDKNNTEKLKSASKTKTAGK